MKNLPFVLLLSVALFSCTQDGIITPDYIDVLKDTGKEPVSFVNDVLDEYDLVIFDDAIHMAKEPYDFYEELMKDEEFRSKVKFVFVEVFPLTCQPLINEYLNSPLKDSSILFPVFQNDYSGYGWRYKTHFDLMSTIWDINAQLPDAEKIRVIGVDPPMYWCAIKTRQDYDQFQRTFASRDYAMYQTIRGTLKNFKSGEKGIFLTNTRHAYKGIKKSDDSYYWNTGTFFHQWHPGKTYSVRFHNVNLCMLSEIDAVSQTSAEGLERVSYEWIRMGEGLWDKAFKENGNVPVGIPLENNLFGQSSYVGNHMLDVAENSSMYDAYDGLIFLAPLEELHFTARVGFIYTDSFIQEVKRRITLLQGDNLPSFLEQEGAESLDDFMADFVKYQEEGRNTLVPEK